MMISEQNDEVSRRSEAGRDADPSVCIVRQLTNQKSIDEKNNL